MRHAHAAKTGVVHYDDLIVNQNFLNQKNGASYIIHACMHADTESCTIA